VNECLTGVPITFPRLLDSYVPLSSIVESDTRLTEPDAVCVVCTPENQPLRSIRHFTS
jgi:hypothetical protein